MYSNYKEKRQTQEILLLLKIFLTYRPSAFELAKITGIDETKIRNVFNDKDLLKKFFPNKYEKAYFIIQKTWQKLDNEDDKIIDNIDLNLFGITEDLQYKFLAHLILTYRLHLNELANILKIDAEILWQKLEKYNENLIESVRFLFIEDEEQPDVALKRISKFYFAYKNAVENNDSKNIQLMTSFIFDDDFNKLVLENKKVGEYQTYDYLTILNYYLKYSFTINDILINIKLKNGPLNRKLKDYIIDKPELFNRYQKLVKYNLHNAYKRRLDHNE